MEEVAEFLGQCPTAVHIEAYLEREGKILGDVLYDFKRDGARKFLEVCEGKGVTMTLITTSNFGALGGVQSSFSSEGNYCEDAAATIFTASGEYRPKADKLSRAVHRSSNHLPIWGDGCDVYLGAVNGSQNPYVNTSTYDVPEIKTKTELIGINFVVCQLLPDSTEFQGRKLSSHLSFNPHYPTEELRMIPKRRPVTKGSCVAISKDDATSLKKLATIEEIDCATPEDLQNVIGLALPTNLQRLVVSAKSADNSILESHVNSIFSDKKCYSQLHTLVLTDANPAAISAVVSLPIPRLMLGKCTEGVQEDFFSKVINNNTLVEVQLPRGIQLSPEPSSIQMIADFNSKKKVLGSNVTYKTLASPVRCAVAATLNDLHDPSSGAIPEGSMGLRTFAGALLAIIPEDAIGYSLLLADMLKNSKDSNENVVPVELDPPASARASQWAAHFLTHFVSEDLHQSSVAMEALSEDKEKFVAIEWNPSYQEFWQQLCEAHQPARLMTFLCELMGIACYLNIPTLKRFVRRAIFLCDALEQQGSQSSHHKDPAVSAP